MADVFSALRPGLVAVASKEGAESGTLRITGPGGDLTSMDSVLITSVMVGMGVNNQYSPALKEVTYVYGFGDRIGSIRISGLTFSKNCQGSGQGIGQVLSWYASSRAVDDVTCQLHLGGGAYSGYLEEVEAGLDNPELQMGSFTLRLASLPSMLSL